MKKRILSSAALILCLIIILPGYAVSDEINWQSYDKGLEMAKEQNKKIFLFFHTDWCYYCKKMKQSTLKNPALIDYLNKYFVSITVNADKEKKISKRYAVLGLPTLWFLKKDSTRISKIPGFVNADIFIKVLKYIQTENYLKMNFQDFLKQYAK